MNVVMTGAGAFVEVQGTAEQTPFGRDRLDELLALAERRHRAGWSALQRRALDARGEQRLHPLIRRLASLATRQPRQGRASWPRSWRGLPYRHPDPRRRSPASSCRPRATTSYAENALGKARAAAAATGLAGARRRFRARGGRARRRARASLGALRRPGPRRRGALRAHARGAARRAAARRTARFRCVIALVEPGRRARRSWRASSRAILLEAPRGHGRLRLRSAVLLPAARRAPSRELSDGGKARGEPPRPRPGRGPAASAALGGLRSRIA